MDRLTCYFDAETGVPRGCCTFDRESATEPDDCISCGEICEENDGECRECQIQKAFNKLAEYEDLEEQNLLLRLPCKVGDTVYVVPSNTNYRINIVNGHTEYNRVYYQKVSNISIYSVGTYSLITCEGMGIVSSDFLGETWFLTENEANDKLKELEELNKHLTMP